MQLKTAILFSAGLMMASANAMADAPASYKKCTKCHGDDGAGLRGNPTIKGMSADTAKTALEAYKAGTRKHPIMNMMAKKLNDAAIAELSGYIATLK